MPVESDQKTNYGYSVSKPSIQQKQARYYPIVDIRSRIDDFTPEETLTKGISHRLLLPVYEVNCWKQKFWKRGYTHSFSRTESAVVFNCLMI